MIKILFLNPNPGLITAYFDFSDLTEKHFYRICHIPSLERFQKHSPLVSEFNIVIFDVNFFDGDHMCMADTLRDIKQQASDLPLLWLTTLDEAQSHSLVKDGTVHYLNPCGASLESIVRHIVGLVPNLGAEASKKIVRQLKGTPVCDESKPTSGRLTRVLVLDGYPERFATIVEGLPPEQYEFVYFDRSWDYEVEKPDLGKFDLVVFDWTFTGCEYIVTAIKKNKPNMPILMASDVPLDVHDRETRVLITEKIAFFCRRDYLDSDNLVEKFDWVKQQTLGL